MRHVMPWETQNKTRYWRVLYGYGRVDLTLRENGVWVTFYGVTVEEELDFRRFF